VRNASGQVDVAVFPLSFALHTLVVVLLRISLIVCSGTTCCASQVCGCQVWAAHANVCGHSHGIRYPFPPSSLRDMLLALSLTMCRSSSHANRLCPPWCCSLCPRSLSGVAATIVCLRHRSPQALCGGGEEGRHLWLLRPDGVDTRNQHACHAHHSHVRRGNPVFRAAHARL